MINTKSQQQAIDSKSNKLLISASAGSGKTTTMIMRIIQILEKKSATLEELLVLTFTEESAKDMKRKLKKGLGDKISNTDLQAASIGTFHGFCANVIRSWFSVADVSPSFAVLDEIESKKIKADILINETILERYKDAKQVIDLFCSARKTDGLCDVVYKLCDFLETRKDADLWLDKTALLCYDKNINSNQAINELINYYKESAEQYRKEFIDFNHKSAQVDFVIDLANKIINAKTYQDLHLLSQMPKFPDIKKEKDFILYEEFHKLRNDFKDLFYELQKYFAEPIDDVKKNITEDSEIARQLVLLAKDFMQRYKEKKQELKKLDFSDLERYTLKILSNKEAREGIRAKYKYIFVDEGQDTNPVQFEIINILRGEDKFFYIVGDIKQSIYGFRGCEPDIFEDVGMEELMQVIPFNKNFRSNSTILGFVNSVCNPLIKDYQQKHKFIVEEEPKEDKVKIELTNSVPEQMELVYRQIKKYNGEYKDIAILSESTTHFADLKNYLSERGIPCAVDRSVDALQEPEIVVLNNFLFAAANPTNEMAMFITRKALFGYSNDDIAKINLGLKKPDNREEVIKKYTELSRSLSVFEILTMIATEFGYLDNPVVDCFLSAIKNINAFDSVARYLYLILHDMVKIEINTSSKSGNAVKLMTIHHSKGLEFPAVILFNMGDLWSRKGGRAQISIHRKMGICVLSADTENYVKRNNILRAGIDKKMKKIEREEKIRLLYVALTRAEDSLYIVGQWKKQTGIRMDKCMLDLINPVNAEYLEDVEASEIKQDNMQSQNQEEIKLDYNGEYETLVKQSVTALSSQSEEYQDYVASSKFGKDGGKEYGTMFHKKMQYGELPEIITDLIKGYTVYKEFPFLYMQDKTIVQGIIDLLAVNGNDAIIIDYKTTRATEDELKRRYSAQLAMYANAVSGYNVKTYIYSTIHEKLIVVS